MAIITLRQKGKKMPLAMPLSTSQFVVRKMCWKCYILKVLPCMWINIPKLPACLSLWISCDCWFYNAWLGKMFLSSHSLFRTKLLFCMKQHFFLKDALKREKRKEGLNIVLQGERESIKTIYPTLGNLLLARVPLAPCQPWRRLMPLLLPEVFLCWLRFRSLWLTVYSPDCSISALLMSWHLGDDKNT